MSRETNNQSAVREMLRNPNTGNDLVGADGDMVDRETGERFPIEDGIPVVLRDGDIVGLNRTYQTRYDCRDELFDVVYHIGGINSFNRYYQDPEPGVYDPPVEHIPEEILDVSITELWNGNVYMVSFRKLEA